VNTVIVIHLTFSKKYSSAKRRRPSQINHEAEAYDDDMTLNFEQYIKLTLLKSEYPLNPVLVGTGFLDPVNPVPTKTGFSEYSQCYIIILHTVKSTAVQKGDGRVNPVPTKTGFSGYSLLSKVNFNNCSMSCCHHRPRLRGFFPDGRRLFALLYFLLYVRL
jgi:hypothetical protein